LIAVGRVAEAVKALDLVIVVLDRVGGLE